MYSVPLIASEKTVSTSKNSMNSAPLSSRVFWQSSVISVVLLGIFFAWELNMLAPYISGPPRAAATDHELLFTGVLIVLLALNIGLLSWQKKHGTCDIGAKRASTIAGGIGALTLLCPACLILPISFLGVTFSLAVLAPYLPLLRIIAILLLGVSTVVLWPKKSS